jgi:GNAT superfamily N-acetyltransferase
MPPVAPSLPTIGGVRRFELREIPLAQTRELRRTVLRPHQTMTELASHEPANAYAVGAFDGDELIAVGFVAPSDERSWRIRGMATAAGHRGRGAGSRVLSELVDHAVRHGAARIWCNARVSARSLYERGGFAVVSDEFDAPQTGPHYVMEKVVLR